MEQPLFTIVVPVYNVEQYLNRCVESIVNQTYTSLDIILVNDGSTDSCPEMCDEWARKDTRIKVVHKPNQGLGLTRNTGLHYAKGKYVCFVDSDDYLMLDAVERCVIELEKYNADTLLFGRYDAYPDGRVVKDSRHVVKNQFVGQQIVNNLLPQLFSDGQGYGVSACSKVFSVKIFNDNNIRFRSEREIISEDAYFCIDYFSKAQSVLVIPDRFYCYYKNYKSLSRTFRDDRQKKNDEFLIQSLEHLEELSLSDVLDKYLKSKYHVFSLAAMKHIVKSQLSHKDKKIKLREIYKDKLLRKTITIDVLQVDKVTIAMFMVFVKLKIYLLCDILLKIKV